MFHAQRQEFPASRHIEWPESGLGGNDWRQTFEWVRRNTPTQAYFVMNSRYLEHPGEDFHGFRGLAELGMLDDQLEDRPAAAVVPAWPPNGGWNPKPRAVGTGFQRLSFMD